MLSEDFKAGEVLLIPCDKVVYTEKKIAKAPLLHPCIRTRGGSSPLLKKRPRLLGTKPSAFVHTYTHTNTLFCSLQYHFNLQY